MPNKKFHQQEFLFLSNIDMIQIDNIVWLSLIILKCCHGDKKKYFLKSDQCSAVLLYYVII